MRAAQYGSRVDLCGPVADGPPMMRLVSFLFVFMASLARAEPVTIFAAVSLKPALDEIVTVYNAAHDAQMRVSYGASSTLARQIEQGAPADVYWSAHVEWMARLSEMALVQDVRTPIGNTLVLVGASPDALCADRLVTADTRAVPLGLYARQALAGLGAWPLPRGCLIQAENARAAVVVYQRGEAGAAILYASDVMPGQAHIALDPQSHDPVRYPVAAVTPAGASVLNYLTSAKAVAVFAAHGFARNE